MTATYEECTVPNVEPNLESQSHHSQGDCLVKSVAKHAIKERISKHVPILPRTAEPKFSQDLQKAQTFFPIFGVWDVFFLAG